MTLLGCASKGLKTVPPTDPFPQAHWGKRACAIIGAYNGSAEQGEQTMAPLLGSVPPPLFNWMGEMPFPAMQALFDPFFPKGLQWYWKGDFVKSRPDEAIAAYIAQAGQAPSDFSLMHLYPIDGAVRRVAKDATAWSTRDASWSMVIAGIDPDPKNAGALKTWGRAYWNAVHPFNLGGGYVNFMMDDEADDRLRATYGDNDPRARGGEGQVRSEESVPGQSEHPALGGCASSPAVGGAAAPGGWGVEGIVAPRFARPSSASSGDTRRRFPRGPRFYTPTPSEELLSSGGR